MNKGYVLLVEKEEIWAQMLLDVLENKQISYITVPVNGAGLGIKTGMMERLKVYVPSENLQEATEVVEELFSAEIIQEEEDDIAMSPQNSNYVIQYLPIGLCLGAALGVAIQNIGMGIFIGVGIGAFIDFMKNKKR